MHDERVARVQERNHKYALPRGTRNDVQDHYSNEQIIKETIRTHTVCKENSNVYKMRY